jgi:type II secretory pathway component PulM
MKTRLKELRATHWSNRPAQERRIIAIVSLLLLPVIYYYLLWQPAHFAVAKLHITLPTLQAQATKLQDQATEIEMLRHRPALVALDAVALKSSITESATRHQLSTFITGIEVQEPNEVRITCDAISFSVWVTWLRQFEQEQHIRTDAISISALPQAGMVKISASLSNGIIQ